MLNKYSNICKIDKVLIEDENGRAVSKLRRYVESHHKISFEAYVLKYYYKNVKPMCLCGCGKETLFFKGNYFKYFNDHKNNTMPTDEAKKKTHINRLLKNGFDFRLKRLGFTIQELTNLYEKFIGFEINFSDIEKIYGIDKRTLKKYWNELKLIENNENFNRICKRHQSYWSNKNDGHKKRISEDVLYEIYKFIKTNPNKYTLKETKELFSIENTILVIYKRLIEHFDKKEIDSMLKLGISSRPETEFYNVLKFYYGDDVQKNYILEKKHYDYILINKILIEYDGDYWHSKPNHMENDKIKNAIAQKNGFIVFRIKDSESKNIEILNALNRQYKRHKNEN